MPTVPSEDQLSRPVVCGCDFKLWDDVPDGWLRSHGRTRVLVVDDQLTSREHFFGVSSPKAPPSTKEDLLRRWLNTEVVFLAQPANYRYESVDDVPQGTFDERWFNEQFERLLADPTPVAVVLLDLLYGAERDIGEASGPRFLTLIRKRLPDVPVLVLSNLEGSLTVRGIVKKGGDGRIGDVSFEDYLAKRVDDGTDLMDRLIEQLLAWADLSDPTLAAISPRMRRLAREMRRIALYRQRVSYQESNAEYPKPVIITGPVGSGKNYVAQRLWEASTRRTNPYQVADFSGHEEKDFTVSLFGVGSYTEGAYFYRVRRSDGTVISENANLKRLHPKATDLVLCQIGILHKAHIAGQGPVDSQRPMGGTVLIDEIGTAPPDMQTRLLGVFNRGRFTPHLTSVDIPEKGVIDVWFLVTLSPEGQEKLRSDLRTRLEQGHRIDVPPLSDRSEDIFPLAMAQIVDNFVTESPETYFMPKAMQLLREAATTMQVREFIQTVQRLSDMTGSTPYAEADVRSSLGSGLGSANAKPQARQSYVPTSQNGGSKIAGPGELQSALPMTVLEAWLNSGQVPFPAELSDREALKGKGLTVVGGAAAAILSFLEVCADAMRSNNEYSSTRTWNYFAGTKGVKTPRARTQIAALFLIDKNATRLALQRSDSLLWLAADVSSTRRRELQNMVKKLSRQPDQQERFARLGITISGGSMDTDTS